MSKTDKTPKPYEMTDEPTASPMHEQLAVVRVQPSGELERTFARLVETGFEMHREELQLTRDFGAGLVHLVEPFAGAMVRRLDAETTKEHAQARQIVAESDMLEAQARKVEAEAALIEAQARKVVAEARKTEAEAEAIALQAQTDRARAQG